MEGIERFDGIYDELTDPPFTWRGGFIIPSASAVAALLDTELYIAEPTAPDDHAGELFQARYEVRAATRARLRGRRVAVVDDVVNAASAIRATVADLQAADADVIAIGALLVLGTSAADYAERERLTLVRCAALPNRIWEPTACPLCAAGRPLEDRRRDPTAG